MKRWIWPVIVAFSWTNSTLAACLEDEEVFLSCAFKNGRTVEVCTTDETARYTYGAPGQTPELSLSRTFGAGAEKIPWNGVGRSIWEAIWLKNNDVIYEVYGGFDRMTAADDTVASHFGGIVVEDATGQVLLHLHCLPDTFYYAY